MPVSVQLVPCIDMVSKFRNFATVSVPVPFRIKLSVLEPPRTLPLSTEPVCSRNVWTAAVAAPPVFAKLMALTAPLIVPLLVMSAFELLRIRMP